MGYDEHRRAYRILPDGEVHYVVARVVVFDERPIIRRMLNRCTSVNSAVESSDDEFVPPPSIDGNGNPGTQVVSDVRPTQLVAMPQARRSDVDADIASLKESYTPRRL